MAACYSEPITTGRTWDVLVSSDLGAATLAWDNVSNLPPAYEAYLLGGWAIRINLRNSAIICRRRATCP